jgi:hypothetical protein
MLHMMGLFNLGVDVIRHIMSYLEPQHYGVLLQTCKFKGYDFMFVLRLAKCEQQALHAPVAMVTDPVSDTVAPLSHYFLYPQLDLLSTLMDKVLHQVHKEMILSFDARRFLYNFSFYLIDRLVWNSVRYSLFQNRHGVESRKVCKQRQVQSAVRFVMIGEKLGENAVSEAMTKLSIWDSKSDKYSKEDIFAIFKDP